MKKIIVLVSIIMALCSVNIDGFTQVPTYIWAKTLLGNVESIQRAVVVDATGNVYITGVFFGTVDFDPGPGVANITPSPYGCNVYIAKYEANGNYLWAKNIPITASYGGNQMAIDGSNNIYITGYFQGSNIDFDPGAGTAYLSALGGSYDLYFAKYDSNGNYVWAKQLGSTGDDRGTEILTDATGSVFLTGNFSLTVDFDPGAGVASLTSAGTTDIFLAKYNSSGIYQWVKQIGGTSGDDVRDIAFDNSGNIFLTGNFFMTTDFDPSASVANLTSAGASDIFIAKYDAAGNYLWANRFGGTGTDGGSALKADPIGNILITGIFAGTVDFDQGVGIANLATLSSALFFGKYDANGNYLWIKQLPINFYSMDITLDATGNIFISGYYGNGYASPIDMDPGPGVANLNVPSNLPPPTYNILGRYDASGNYLWAGVFGRQCYCSVMAYKSSMTIDAFGYLYYSGIFNGPWGTGTVDFDPGSGIANLTAPSSVDNVFFVKFGIGSGPLPVELVAFTGENKDKINCLKWTTASEINNNYFEVERSQNGIYYLKIGSLIGKGNSSELINYAFDDSTAFFGPNYYRLKQVDFNDQFIYSKIISVINRSPKNICSAYFTQENGKYLLTCPFVESGSFSIIDMRGVFLETKQLKNVNEGIKINLQQYPAGMYLINIYDGQTNRNFKLINN